MAKWAQARMETSLNWYLANSSPFKSDIGLLRGKIECLDTQRAGEVDFFEFKVLKFPINAPTHNAPQRHHHPGRCHISFSYYPLFSLPHMPLCHLYADMRRYAFATYIHVYKL